jgi:DNA-binding MarR family transcriptional regulator
LTTSFHYWKLVVMKNPVATRPDPAVEGVTELTLTVFRLNGALLQWGDELVQPLGLTSARWQMLGAIALAGEPLTAPQVGEVMGVSRQGAQKQLNLLLEQGLVESRPNPAHRRSPLYGLTAQGLELYRLAEQSWNARATALAARLPPARVRAATRTLESLRRRLAAADRSPETES